MICPHVKRQRFDVWLLNQCGLIESIAGHKAYIPEPKCQTCSQKDDGTSHSSKVGTAKLRRRLIADFAREPATCAGCSGSLLTLDEAVKRLKTRVGNAATADLIVEAVRNGMPTVQAEELAARHALAQPRQS